MNQQFRLPADPFGIANSFAKANGHWMANGLEYSAMMFKLISDIQTAGSQELVPLLIESSGWKGPDDDFEAAFLGLVKKYSKLLQRMHAAYGGWLKDYVSNAEGLSEKERQSSAFWAGQFINAISPSNCFWTNPSAVQKFIRTRGKSAVAGYENLVEDVNRGENLISISKQDFFKVGENIAPTPGHVVFRNRLLELIQYEPTTETTFDTPIVFIQPWINKYYIFDLTAEKSFVSWLVNQGFTVFIVSWKNPSPEMRGVTFEDYMTKGALKAVEVAAEICNVEQVHAAGYCIGGTVLSALMAWLNRRPDKSMPIPIRDFTLFASLVDYSAPGELGVYITEDSIDTLEQVMKKAGYLDKKYLSAAFRLLRSNELVWLYYNRNYLQGEDPPKSEFLFWNTDSTRLPYAMCSFYLREFYLKNKLVEEDGLVLARRPIDLGRIEQPLYVVGAELDHICPWKETFKITGLVKGPVRFTLANEGHITGIVNPPSKRSKRRYWTSEITDPVDAEEWLQKQEARVGSWWEDWAGWLSRDCGRREPPSMGNGKYCPLEKAPGSYVLQQ